MAFQLPQSNGYVDVALKIDDALDMTPEQYEAYVEDPVAEKLFLKEGMKPTYIRMRKVLPWKLQSKIEDSKYGSVQTRNGDKVEQNLVPRLSWMSEEVRCAIIDVISPDGEPQAIFHRDAEGGASYEFAAQLSEAGVMRDLWNARKNSMTSTGVDKKK